MMKEFLKTAALLLVAAGLAMALFKTPDGAGGGGLGNSLNFLTEPRDEPKRQPKRKDLVGVVSGHTAGGLLITPFSDDPLTEVKATTSQRDRCPVDARYPDCL